MTHKAATVGREAEKGTGTVAASGFGKNERRRSDGASPLFRPKQENTP